MILLAPLSMLFWRVWQEGDRQGLGAITEPDTIHAFKITLILCAIAVPLNTVFGIVCALAIVRRRFPGKGLVNAFVDLPLALSPVVVGFSLYLLYGRTGWFGPWFTDHGIQVLFALPAMVLATIFVSVPFVAREVVPTLREIGDEQEQAAHTLGASGWQTFWRITLPSIRWAVIYGVVVTTARCLGEYGAVAIVSGQHPGQDRDRDAARPGRVREPQPGRARTASRWCSASSPSLVLVVMTMLQAEGRSQLMSIQVRNVSKRFGDFQALDDVSLDVDGGSLTALLGPSGSGKSTLLRIIAGLEQPDAGEILLEGEDATASPPQKRGVGFVFQHYAAFKHMTVRDNIAFGLKIRKRPRAEITARVDELLELVQLQGFGDRYPAQLSGGQRQRMALARALAPEPKVLLLDEPFGALDARVRAELRVWLRRLHDETHTTTVFVTHDQEEAMEVADRVVVMNKGRVEQVARAARALRRAGERVRDVASSARRTASATPGCARTTSRSSSSRTARPARRRSSGSCTSASRCAASSSRRRRGVLGAADARPGGDARARARPDRLRAPVKDARRRANSDRTASTDRLVRRPGVGVGARRARRRSPAARRGRRRRASRARARARRLARTATHTSRSGSALPW